MLANKIDTTLQISYHIYSILRNLKVKFSVMLYLVEITMLKLPLTIVITKTVNRDWLAFSRGEEGGRWSELEWESMCVRKSE